MEQTKLTREEMRELWGVSGLSYGDIFKQDIYALVGALAAQFDMLSEQTGRAPNPDVSRIDPRVELGLDGTIEAAYVLVSYDGRDDAEGISFNRDGFIGFAGWASDETVQPILRAFRWWATDWMPGGIREACMRSRGQDGR